MAVSRSRRRPGARGRGARRPAHRRAGQGKGRGVLAAVMAGETDSGDWRLRGVRVVHGDELDPNTPQTPGMSRMAAITAASAGAEKLWAGTVDIEPNAKTGA